MTLKRPKLFHHHHHHHHNTEDIEINHNNHRNNHHQPPPPPPPPLIPGLPDHISHLILSQIPPSLLYNISPQWRQLIYSPHFPPFLSLYTLLAPISHSNSTPIDFSCFDPISGRWVALPPPPDPPLHLLSRHPSFISRNLPIQAVTAASTLVVVAATSHHLLPALPRPLVFDPLAMGWAFGPALPVPRRWCAAGSLGGSVYVASGVGSHFSTDTARSVEKWDLRQGREWEPGRPLRDGRFAREAVDAVGWRGRLCMFNVAAKEGAIYDSRRDTWREMEVGMVEGWRGPGAAMDEEEIFVVDEGKGVVRRYEEERDCWVDVVENERLRGAQQLAAGGGRVCVVCGGGEIVVVDVKAAPPRIWVVEPPVGFRAVAVHVLPRMSRLPPPYTP